MLGDLGGPLALAPHQDPVSSSRIVPALRESVDDVGQQALVLERYATKTAGGATLFVYREGELIRVATTLRDAEGASMQGRAFERSHRA